MCGGCGAGWRHLTIVGKGDVLACRRMPVKVGNLFEDSFESILLNSPFLKELRNTKKMGACSTCLYRKFCRGCPADTYSHFGVPFNDSTNCPWYTAFSEEISKDVSEYGELEKLNNSVYELNMYSRCYENNDFIKAMIVLRSEQERKLLLSDSTVWKQKHSLQLNENEIGVLICYLLENHFR